MGTTNPYDTVPPKLPRRCLPVDAACAVAVLSGGLALIGWALRIEALKSLHEPVSMNPATAVLFIFAGVSLWLGVGARGPRTLGLSKALAFAVVAVALLRLIGYSPALNLGVDTLLFPARLHGNTMAPNTAIDFVLLGSAVLLSEVKGWRGQELSPWLALVAAALALMAVAGYYNGVSALFGIASLTPMALGTAASFLVLSGGVAFATMGGWIADRQGSNRHMNHSLEKNVTIGFGAALFLLGVVAVVAIKSLRQFVDSEHWEEHTRQVLLEIADLGMQMKNVQVADREYVITGQDQFLAPYRNASTVIDPDLHELRSMTSDNASEQQRLDQLEVLIREKLAFVGKSAAVRKSQGFEAARQLLLTGEGERLIRQIEQLLDDMRNAEDELLATRAASAVANAHATMAMISGGSALAAVMLTIAALLIRRDIRIRRRVEEELDHRNTLLEAANKELEAFSYSVSHDLRAPLRSIDGFSLALIEDCADKLDAQDRNYLQRVRSATQRMAQLIDDMLTLSRVNRAEMNRSTVDLSAMARAIAAELKKTQPDRQVVFSIADNLTADGDPRLLRVVLDNLLGNAWKFTSKRPAARIEFGASGANGSRVYYVHDNGAGFDMAYSNKLFGAFQRLHAVEEFPGTGVGLATVQRIIHRHGGRVWAEAEPEKGATFRFTL